MDIGIVSFPANNLEKCSSCGCSCSLEVGSSSNWAWIRSVKRKYDEFERSGRFHIPGLNVFPISQVGIKNECALLQETVSSQQTTIQDLCLELEEERNASSSAADEAMSMILRLQSEKAEIEMEARQFKCYAEEKMSHDSKEIASLEDVLYKREQTILSLTCEVQSYKHRMMSFGLTESEVEGLRSICTRHESFQSDIVNSVDSPTCFYPLELEDDTVDVEKYPFGETPTSQDLKNVDFGSKNVLEKVIVGHSPRQTRHSRRSFTDTPSLLGYNRDIPDCSDSPMWGTSIRKSEIGSEYKDDMSDRVYTIDYVHPGAPYNNVPDPNASSKLCDDMANRDVKKLYLRLQALEADRESMRQTIISMRSDKTQLVLLRQIAQQLHKDMAPPKSMPLEKPSILKSFSFLTMFKWILSFVFWKKKGRPSKYMFDLVAKNPGLLLLLDKNPGKLWRCALSTQV